MISSTWLLYFSQPAADRGLYGGVKGKSIRSVVEIGIGSGLRTQRLLEVLSWRADNLPLRYTGIDLFEARPQDQPGLSLKQAFHDLRPKHVTVKLVPGDPYSALLRVANSLAGTDLVIISADQDQESLERAWTYLPRILHNDSLIFREACESKPVGKAPAKSSYQKLTLLEIQRLAAASARAQRRARRRSR